MSTFAGSAGFPDAIAAGQPIDPHKSRGADARAIEGGDEEQIDLLDDIGVGLERGEGKEAP